MMHPGSIILLHRDGKLIAAKKLSINLPKIPRGRIPNSRQIGELTEE